MSLFQSVLQSITNRLTAGVATQETARQLIGATLKVPLLADSLKIIDGKIILYTNPSIKLAAKLREQEIISLLRTHGIHVTTIV